MKKVNRKRFFVILVNPEKAENVGLVARNMKNTGFKDLRLVKLSSIERKSYITAVHAQDVLDEAEFYPKLSQATADLDLVFAATAKRRKNFPSISLDEAVEKMWSFPYSSKIGLLFGNERTGLTSYELCNSNFRFVIPQVSRQPSYNLASAVLLTLYPLFKCDPIELELKREGPLTRNEQEECIELILSKLEKRQFMNKKNKEHVSEMVYDLFGRLTMTEKDRKLLLAIFSKI